MSKPLEFHPQATVDEKLYELAERIASTHYSGVAEARYHLERFIVTARLLIEEYNDVSTTDER